MADPNEFLNLSEEGKGDYLFQALLKFGVSRDRAIDLSKQLAQLQIPPEALDDPSYWKDWGRWVQEWAGSAKSAEYQRASAMYTALYNPRTGRARQEELQEQESIRAQTGEQNTLQQVERVKQQQLSRQQAEIERAGRIAPLRAGTEISAPALERLRESVSPAGQAFFERELPRIYQQMGMERGREASQQQRASLLRQRAGLNFKEGEGNEVQLERKEVREELKKIRDPWEVFLEFYPFMEKFKALSPEERGYRSRQFRPPTRTLTR